MSLPWSAQVPPLSAPGPWAPPWPSGLTATAPWTAPAAQRRRGRRQAALATLVLTGLGCWLLSLGDAPPSRLRRQATVDEQTAAPRLSWLRLLPAPAHPAHPTPAEAPQRPHERTTSAASALSGVSAISAVSAAAAAPRATARPALEVPAPAITLLPAEEAPVAAAAVPAASAASAPPPLRLDGEVMRSAVQASKGLVQRQAEASGAYMGDAPISKQEKLARAIAGSAKPGCLEQGGSLLAVFTIAYAVVADKCQGLHR